MVSSATQRSRRSGKRPQSVAAMDRWKLEDAKARLSEVVRLAGTHGPQLVTIRGKEAAVILAPEHYMELLPKPDAHVPLVDFLQKLRLDRIDVRREMDRGRKVNL